MEAKEIKVNLDLMNALIKMREASIIFEEQLNVIGEQAGIDYIEEREEFLGWTHPLHERNWKDDRGKRCKWRLLFDTR
ncbi:MAG: hypothetical protein ACLVEJ_26060 [Parabacteroides sp.]